MPAPDIREELRELGALRRATEEDSGALAARIKDALRRAHGEVPTTEAAQLLGLDRSTLYRVYLRAA